MRAIEKTAKTAEEAIQQALAELRVPRERAKIEILEEGRPLFGILGSSQARVRVTAEQTIGETAAQLLAQMVSHMGVEATTEVVEEDEVQAVIDIKGEDLGLLIGKHGQTLAAIQHLLGLMINRGLEERKRIILDAEGYRERREESLRHLAIASARKAKQTGEPVTLDPLLPHERRIVHTTLADDPDITTRSVGEDPTRRIVVEARGGAEHTGPPAYGPRPQSRERGERGGYQPREWQPSRETPEAAETPEPEEEESRETEPSESQWPESEGHEGHQDDED
jgi:spoIIIJ-associated protein